MTVSSTEVLEKIDALPFVNESKWEDHPFSRCITDYVKVVTFERLLTREELVAYCDFLQKNDCPGWTSVKVTSIINTTYKFETTMDSSG